MQRPRCRTIPRRKGLFTATHPPRAPHLHIDIDWMGKAQWFRGPFGPFGPFGAFGPFSPLMRWLGGIAVDRSPSTNLVAASARAIRETDGRWPLCMVVPPAGPRSKTRQWKTGFYGIAHEAGVPIVMAYRDFPRKLSGLGLVFKPTGDIEADMVQVQAFCNQFKSKNWRQFSPD